MASLFRPKLNLYRNKKLDIGSFVNIKVIRDHTKRQVYEAYEAERYGRLGAFCSLPGSFLFKLLNWEDAGGKNEMTDQDEPF